MKKKRELNQINWKWNLIFILILGIVGMLIVLPVLLIVIISFSSTASINEAGYTFFPIEWSLEGYYYTFKLGIQLVYSYLVTIASSAIGTVLGLIVMSMYAYVICQKRFWLERGLTWFLFFTMLFGGGLVPSYILNVRYYHLNDTFWMLLLSGILNAYWVIILRTFIKTSIPEALFDSARIDGAGHFTIFFKIACPLFKAGLGTIGLFSFVGRWNDWFTGMLYIDNNKLMPLQTLLTKMQNNVDYLKSNSEVASTPEGLAMLKNLPGTNLRMACTVLAVVPILFAYPFFQRYFVQGLTVGSIKE
ncbi:MAG: carbohydrate ABC transporter permease [Lachnospiraceae bacterium]|jgi:putative aldouronate transport system permease protein|nr:carbohydrate ABC transporter permease [uncultured Acetatifactor sp.]MCI9221290.1 carbohydrate ABC transporter permease [Lachnospiraceae bacterium]